MVALRADYHNIYAVAWRRFPPHPPPHHPTTRHHASYIYTPLPPPARRAAHTAAAFPTRCHTPRLHSPTPHTLPALGYFGRRAIYRRCRALLNPTRCTARIRTFTPHNLPIVPAFYYLWTVRVYYPFAGYPRSITSRTHTTAPIPAPGLYSPALAHTYTPAYPHTFCVLDVAATPTAHTRLRHHVWLTTPHGLIVLVFCWLEQVTVNGSCNCCSVIPQSQFV